MVNKNQNENRKLARAPSPNHTWEFPNSRGSQVCAHNHFEDRFPTFSALGLELPPSLFKAGSLPEIVTVVRSFAVERLVTGFWKTQSHKHTYGSSCLNNGFWQ